MGSLSRPVYCACAGSNVPTLVAEYALQSVWSGNHPSPLSVDGHARLPWHVR
ncbi:Uncharacterised protein [Vibrio cholerae]|nr:Uncharacterised protein [Vibrio cholerae]